MTRPPPRPLGGDSDEARLSEMEGMVDGRMTQSPLGPVRPFSARNGAAPRGSALLLLALATLIADESEAQDRWEFSITPYAWLMDVEGTVAALPGQPPVDISVSWQDVLKDVDAGGMILMNARRSGWVIRGDLLYAETSSGTVGAAVSCDP